MDASCNSVGDTSTAILPRARTTGLSLVGIRMTEWSSMRRPGIAGSGTRGGGQRQHRRQRRSALAHARFPVVDVSVQDWPEPTVPLRAIPLIADVKGLD